MFNFCILHWYLVEFKPSSIILIPKKNWNDDQIIKIKIKAHSISNTTSSNTSAPPPAIEMLTSWEIILRVSFTSNLPWWPLPRSFTYTHLPQLLLRPLASPPTGFLILSSFKHACVNVSPPYPTLQDTSCLVICMVSYPPPIVNTRSLVSSYRWSSCPGGPALWYCTLSWVAWSVWSAFKKS